MYGLPAVLGRAGGGVQTEASWRAARWDFLRDVANCAKAVVLTAHTRDDQVETVLMRALRGAGARGLAGLRAPSPIRRPFLSIARAQLREYAREREVVWLEDPTNASPRFLRNRIRHDLLPAMRRENPNIDDELFDIGSRAAGWRKELSGLLEKAVHFQLGTGEHGTVALDVTARDLDGYPDSVLAILWPELASRAGLTLDARGTRRAVEFTMSSRAGRRIQLSGGWELIRSRGAFELRAALASDAWVAAAARALCRSMVWDRWSFEVDEQGTPHDLWRASLPASEQFSIRAWRPGDRLTISHGGRLIARKVKYFLSDAGISGHIRRRWPVVVAGDEIVWIPGVRRSDAATARSGGPVVTYVCDYLDRRS